MLDTSLRRLALSNHQLPPLCGSDDLTRPLAEAKLPFARHALTLTFTKQALR